MVHVNVTVSAWPLAPARRAPLPAPGRGPELSAAPDGDGSSCLTHRSSEDYFLSEMAPRLVPRLEDSGRPDVAPAPA